MLLAHYSSTTQIRETSIRNIFSAENDAGTFDNNVAGVWESYRLWPSNVQKGLCINDLLESVSICEGEQHLSGRGHWGSNKTFLRSQPHAPEPHP